MSRPPSAPDPPVNLPPDPPRSWAAGPARGWRGLGRSALSTVAAVGARGVGSLALNKLLAGYGGPGGLTQLAQFQNLLALLTALPAEGVQVGAITYLAPLQPGRPRYRWWLAAAAWATGAAVAAGTAVLALAGGPAWPLGRALAVGAGVLLVAGQALLGAALLAAGHPAAYAGLVAAAALLGPAAAAAALARGWPLPQVLLAYLGGQALAAPLAVGTARRRGLLRGMGTWAAPSPVALRTLGRFVLTAAATLLFGRAVDYAVRAYLMAHFAPARTDEWQAVGRVSELVALVVGAGLSTVFYPRLAALAPAPAAQQRFLRRSLGGLALGLGLGLGLLYGARLAVLPLLFAPRLAAAAGLLAPQLLGDWARLLSWALQYQLLARRRLRAYLLVQAAAAALYLGLLATWLGPYGLRGVVLANAGRYAGVLLLSGLLVWGGRQPGRGRPAGSG